MGMIRLLLALSVVFDHSGGVLGTSLVGGRTAVECFFVISGFYMAMVIEQKYGRLQSGMWKTFMASRAVRLYPVYLTVLALSVVSLAARQAVGGHPFVLTDLHLLSPVSLLVLVVTNLAILGQDLVQFLHLNSAGNLELIGKLTDPPQPAHLYLLLPQTWTLSVELIFYACAPWLLRRRSSLLLVVLALSVGLRIILVSAGLGHDPWSYRFFPVELSLFVTGALAYRWTKELRARQPSWLGPVLFGVLALCFIAYTPWLTHRWAWMDYIFPFLFAPAVPFVFTWTSRNARDRWIGELSYPLYVVHLLILQTMRSVGLPDSGIPVGITSIAAAVALLVVVDGPMERWRQRRLAQVISNAEVPAPSRGEPVPT